MKVVLLLCAVIAGVAASYSISPVTTKASLPCGAGESSEEPGDSKCYTAVAEGDPDLYAWILFAYLNRQAKSGEAGVADPTKPPFSDDKDSPQDDRETVWESWALVNSFSSEAFPGNGLVPAKWEDLVRKDGAPKILSPVISFAPEAGPAIGVRIMRPLIPPDGDSQNGMEVRMNRSSYETIRENGLYNQLVITAAIRCAQQSRATSFVSFCSTAKEVKAAWVVLCKNTDENTCNEQKKRYHWRTFHNAGGFPVIWGLAALHIMTKDLHDQGKWFFADFIHEDCETLTAPCNLAVTTIPEINTTDSTSTTTKPKSDRIGTRWEHYHLRGTQIDFMKNGKAVELSNPALENGNKPTSCMTCHAYASAGLPMSIASRDDSDDDPLPRAPISQLIGIPASTPAYQPAGTISSAESTQNLQFLQSDFEWSIQQNARRPPVTAASTAQVSASCNAQPKVSPISPHH